MDMTADEIVDLRIWPLEASDRWRVRYRFKSGYIYVAPAGSLNAMAMAARLRRPPALRVIEGGRTAPTTSAKRYDLRLALIAG
jgi:hypothetical protein